MVRLVGVDHLDPKGYTRATAILEDIEPKVVGIEDTYEGYHASLDIRDDIENDYSEFKKNFVNVLEGRTGRERGEYNKETLDLILQTLHYEAEAVNDYAGTDKPVLFGENLAILQGLNEEGFDYAMFVTMLDLTPSEYRENVKENYEKDKPITSDKWVKSYKKRDEYTERRMRNVFSNLTEDIVYFGGLDHIFGDYSPNLADRLSDITTKRMKLDEADQI